MANDNVAGIDLNALQAEVSKMSTAELEKQVLELRVREKKQQKKMQGSETQKKYQLRQREIKKLLKERAKQLGIYDKINEEAEARAESELTAEAGEAGGEEEDVA